MSKPKKKIVTDSKTPFADRKRFGGFMLDPTEDLVIIGLDTKHKKGEHRFYDERILIPLVDSDVQNVVEYGIVEEILYTRIRIDPNSSVKSAVIVDGRQRCRWGRAASKIKGEVVYVPSREATGTELQLWIRSRIANAVRVESSSMTIAREMLELVGMGMSEAEVAVIYSVSVADVRDHLRLNTDICPKGQSLLESKAMKFTAAKLLFGLSENEQTAKLDEVLASGQKLTVDRIRTSVARVSTTSTPRLSAAQLLKLYEDKENLPLEVRKVLGVVLRKRRPQEVPGMAKAFRELGFKMELDE